MQYLPIGGDIWKQIALRFKPHSVIRKALIKNKTYSTWVTSRSTVEPVELFTAVTSSRWLNSIAISSTHYSKSRLTLAVVYGCNEDQMEKIQHLLKASPEVRAHPFLMAGVFAELQRDRVEDLVRSKESELDYLLINLQVYRVDVSPGTREFGWTKNQHTSLFRSEVKNLEEEASAIKDELEKMVRHMERVAKSEEARMPALVQQEEREAVQDFVAKTERFVARFGEICTELNSFMGRCRMASEELTFARELVSAPEFHWAGR